MWPSSVQRWNPPWRRNCGRCGWLYTANHRCPARNAECRRCQNTGHFARVCGPQGIHLHGLVPQISPRRQPRQQHWGNTPSDEANRSRIKSSRRRERDQKRLEQFIRRKSQMALFPFSSIDNEEMKVTLPHYTSPAQQSCQCKEMFEVKQKQLEDELELKKLEIANKTTELAEVRSELHAKVGIEDALNNKIMGWKDLLEQYKEEYSLLSRSKFALAAKNEELSVQIEKAEKFIEEAGASSIVSNISKVSDPIEVIIEAVNILEARKVAYDDLHDNHTKALVKIRHLESELHSMEYPSHGPVQTRHDSSNKHRRHRQQLQRANQVPFGRQSNNTRMTQGYF